MPAMQVVGSDASGPTKLVTAPMELGVVGVPMAEVCAIAQPHNKSKPSTTRMIIATS
jgi:hypothetical protein